MSKESLLKHSYESRVHVGDGFSGSFEMKVSVHQGSVLSPSLFIVVLEALLLELKSWGSLGKTIC